MASVAGGGSASLPRLPGGEHASGSFCNLVRCGVVGGEEVSFDEFFQYVADLAVGVTLGVVVGECSLELATLTGASLCGHPEQVAMDG